MVAATMLLSALLEVSLYVNQVEHPSRKTCRDTLPPNAT
jgi:hypothetical protein